MVVTGQVCEDMASLLNIVSDTAGEASPANGSAPQLEEAGQTEICWPLWLSRFEFYHSHIGILV